MTDPWENPDTGRKALFWDFEKGGVKCLLCPHECMINEGNTGLCMVRKNIEGKGLVSLNYGSFSSISVDPIEKKPLYHWHPGSKILSLGSVGCNMTCPFCQNWPIATWQKDLKLIHLEPHEIVELTKGHGLESVAFTYNEPVVGYEFLLDTSIQLKESGLGVVIVSNGLICKEPLLDILPFIDAANIDLKCFTGEGYRKLGGDLETVKRSIELIQERGVHLELTHLIVPGINDDIYSFTSMVRWIRNISEDIVLHLSRYFPNYKWHRAATPLSVMNEFEEIALSQLNYVYLGNVSGECITRCKECGKEMIVRNGYSVSLCKTDPTGGCPYCGTDNNIEI